MEHRAVPLQRLSLWVALTLPLTPHRVAPSVVRLSVCYVSIKTSDAVTHEYRRPLVSAK